MPRPAKSTTAKGLGWPHQQQVKALRDKHVDGSPCWWCGRAMFLDAARNWDSQSLAGDHSVPRAAGGRRTDRLLHGYCNSARGDGSRDDTRPTITGTEVRIEALDRRRMPWPIW